MQLVAPKSDRRPDANEQQKEELSNWICAEHPVLVAGAGTSNSRYGGWQDLIGNLEALAAKYGLGFKPDPVRRTTDFLSYIDDIRDALTAANEQNRYYHYLTTTYSQTDVAYDEVHRLLVSLPFSGLMTTNYDPCFGAAIAASTQGAFEPYRLLSGGAPAAWDEWLRSLESPHTSQSLILHCHGYYLYPQSIVLSARDYKQLYGPLPAAKVETERGLLLNSEPTVPAQFRRSIFMLKAG